eukprot:460437-Hanusia_phi.AAC.2
MSQKRNAERRVEGAVRTRQGGASHVSATGRPGLSTTVLPMARAGASFHDSISRGKFLQKAYNPSDLPCPRTME